MQQKTVKPLEVKTLLAGTPKEAPRWGTDLALPSGETIRAVDPKATRAMISLMDMQAVMGGAASHFGGPSAVAELMSATHAIMFHEAQQKKQQWHQAFHFVNDAGHHENGLYALKANYGFADLNLDSLKGFRSIQSPLTGHGESHLFPQGVYISNGPLGSALPQAQGLAFADRLAGRDRVTMCLISDGACMEGEAREALAAIPGLAARGRMAPFVLMISDNNTNLTGRIDELCFSMSPTFASLAAKGWKVIKLETSESHDLKSCAKALTEALNEARSNPDQPVAILAKTIKGYGTEKTAKSSSGAHGFPLKEPSELRAFLQEIYQGEAVPEPFLEWCQELEKEGERRASQPKKPAPAVPSEKVQVGISAAMIRKRQEGLPVISVSSDLPGSTGVADFKKQFPECSVDVGVAEANMVSTGAGLSKEGYIPVVDTFSQFGVTKGALPLTMAALSQAPVIAVFSHAGFQDAADGASHQALTYLAKTSAIPHTDVYALTCSAEADALMGQAIDEFAKARQEGRAPHSHIFFLGRENFPRHYQESAQYSLGRAQIVLDTTKDTKSSVTIAASGPLLPQALKAAEELKGHGIGCVVVNPAIINRPDVKTFETCLAKTGNRLLTVEDHQVIGGMGSLLIHALVENGMALKAHSLGVRGEFGQSAYKASELYEKHGLDAASIVRQVKTLVG